MNGCAATSTPRHTDGTKGGYIIYRSREIVWYNVSPAYFSLPLPLLRCPTHQITSHDSEPTSKASGPFRLDPCEGTVTWVTPWQPPHTFSSVGMRHVHPCSRRMMDHTQCSNVWTSTSLWTFTAVRRWCQSIALNLPISTTICPTQHQPSSVQSSHHMPPLAQDDVSIFLSTSHHTCRKPLGGRHHIYITFFSTTCLSSIKCVPVLYVIISSYGLDLRQCNKVSSPWRCNFIVKSAWGLVVVQQYVVVMDMM